MTPASITNDVQIVDSADGLGAESRLKTGVKPMETMLTVLGVLGGWIALQSWVLPRLGVPT